MFREFQMPQMTAQKIKITFLRSVDWPRLKKIRDRWEESVLPGGHSIYLACHSLKTKLTMTKIIYPFRVTSLIVVMSLAFHRILSTIRYYYSIKFFSLLIMILPSMAFAQKTITGKVFDADSHRPLPSVSVMPKGNKFGLVTSEDGSFIMSIPENVNTIVVSYVGHESSSIRVDGPGNEHLAGSFLQGFHSILIINSSIFFTRVLNLQFY
jgi:hypothetical protein